VIDRLNASARKALASAEVKRQLDAQGDSPVGSSVADFSAFVRAEHKYWVAFVQSAGIKVD
jgi:tripartite-type tricarboxylate transporter receptor subunit TctC